MQPIRKADHQESESSPTCLDDALNEASRVRAIHRDALRPRLKSLKGAPARKPDIARLSFPDPFPPPR